MKQDIRKIQEQDRQELVRQTYAEENPFKKVEKTYSEPTFDSPYRFKDEAMKLAEIETLSSKIKIPVKADVETEGLDDKTKTFISEVYSKMGVNNDLPFDIVVTSGTEGVHMEGSKHYTGQALDIRISPNFRGTTEGVDTPWDDPTYKFFTEGYGAEIAKRYGFKIEHNLEHGDAPHIHLEQGTGKYREGDFTARNKSDYNNTNTQDNSIDYLAAEPMTEEVAVQNFITDASNTEKDVNDKKTVAEENEAMGSLVKQQIDRTKLIAAMQSYSSNFITDAPEETAPQGAAGGYRPNQMVTTQYQTLGQASGLFEDGGQTTPPPEENKPILPVYTKEEIENLENKGYNTEAILNKPLDDYLVGLQMEQADAYKQKNKGRIKELKKEKWRNLPQPEKEEIAAYQVDKILDRTPTPYEMSNTPMKTAKKLFIANKKESISSRKDDIKRREDDLDNNIEMLMDRYQVPKSVVKGSGKNKWKPQG